MSTKPYPFTRQSWMQEFSKKALIRGWELHQQRCVRELTWIEEGFDLDAVVEDPLSEPMEASIILDEPFFADAGVDAVCDCRVGLNCAHSAAALFTALSQGLVHADVDADYPALNPDAQDEEAAASRTLPRELTAWLSGLERTHETGVEEKCYSNNNKLILYLLEPKDAGRGVELVWFQTTLLKSGRYGKTKRYDHEKILAYRAPGFTRPSDLRIARLMRLLDYSGLEAFKVEGPDFPNILTVLLETGRLHWESFKNRPLTLGEARPAKPVWTAEADGTQRANFEVDPPASFILPTEPPWYIDASTQTTGPLETGMTPLEAVLWLDAPPVKPFTAIALNQALEKRANKLSLPKARALEVEEISSISPKPVLELHTKRLHWWEVNLGFSQTGMDGARVHMAKVYFDYQGVRVAETVKRKCIEELRKDRVVRVRRDFNAEGKWASSLSKYLLAPSDAENDFPSANGRDSGRVWKLPDSSPDRWFQFSTEILPQLKAEGWIVEYHKSFEFKIAEPQEWYAEALPEPGNEWFDMELGVQVDGEKVNLLPVLINLLRNPRPDFSAKKLAEKPGDSLALIPLEDGRVLPFPVKRLRDIMATLTELYDPSTLNKKGRISLPKLRAAEVAGLGGDADWRWHGGDALRELGLRLKDFKGIKPVRAPGGLRAKLRPYQKDGLDWLQFLREYELAGVLADDMGLGKTVQALAHLLVEKKEKRLDFPCLVVAPTSLMVNWRQEATRFAPKLRLLVSHGGNRKEHFDKLEKYDLIVTSYALLPRDKEVLLATQFHLIILDEAQYIKNPKSQYSQIACRLKARHRLCMTGTPMENHLGELWSLFNFLIPGFLGDHVRFRSIFRNPIEKGGDADRRAMLARRVAPFILRRRKEEVMKELPAKTEIVQNVDLSDEQRDLYESIRLAMHARVKEEIAARGMNRSQIVILDALLKLRQVCCDPRLVKLDAAKNVRQSSKLELLIDLLPEMLSEGRRILLFSQFTSMLELIELELKKLKIQYVKLTGQTTDRETPITQFQEEKVPLFLISLKAGGTGLNLTAADTVIHYDPWWNPAVENQATDRAHRIGQSKKVFVYKLMTVGTVEEKIAALQSRKRQLVEGLLNEDRRESLQLTAQELEVLFEPLS